MSESHCCQGSSVCQTLDELDFERGIWYAAQYNDIKRVEDLLRKNQCVNLKDKAGYTALHYATRNGHLNMCKLLISNGADVNALTKCGKVSALHRSASGGYLEIFKLLLQSGANIYEKDDDGKTVLHRAVESGHVDIVKEILKVDWTLKNESDKKGKLPINYSNISEEICELLKEDVI